MKKIVVALAGNPNSGKTTLFNALTGFNQKVGNWPGVTVERKEGSFTFRDTEVKIIDLPGIYSFSAYSLDEKISREYILKEKIDLVLNIVDATNLERNLYLTTQIIEMKKPVMVALNMTDLAKQKRINIETEHLAQHLDCKVVPIVASKKKGIEQLKEEIIQQSKLKKPSRTKVAYDTMVEEAIVDIEKKTEFLARDNSVDSRWLSIKLLESDELAKEITANKYQDFVQDKIMKIAKHTGMETDIVVADGRYGFINGLSKDVVHKDSMLRKSVSDAVDKIVLNKVLGVPVFLFIMYLVFQFTTYFAEPFIEFFEIFSGTIFVEGFGNLLETLSFPQWLVTFLADGIGGGIETVSTFIPPIFFIFFALSILEDSGYMARAAFVMDKFMRYIGLPGKAFIPMLVGFGCNVPAILATRTLEDEKDRTLTILINPLMSCGAKLPVYAVFASIFFTEKGGQIIFSLYLVGILLGILSGFVFKKTLFKGDTSSFVMELPPYHLPTINGILLHTWRRLSSFILRAGKVILIAVVVLSFLNSIGTDGSFNNEDSDDSILSYIGKQITPVFHPMGIRSENWPATVGLFTGVFAKEVIIGTLDALYTSLETDRESIHQEVEEFWFWGRIADAFTAIWDGFFGDEEEFTLGSSNELSNRFGGKNNAYAYLLFILVYFPCIATIGAIYRELNLKWTIFSALYLTGLAWIVSTIFYQLSTFPENPARSTIWIMFSISMYISFYIILKLKPKKMIRS